MNAPAKIDAAVGEQRECRASRDSAPASLPMREQDLPYYRLHGLSCWRGPFLMRREALLRAANIATAISSTPSSSRDPLPAEAAGHALRLMVKLVSPTGDVAAERMLDWPASPPPK